MKPLAPQLALRIRALARRWHSFSRPTRIASIAVGALVLLGLFEGGHPDGASDWFALALALTIAFCAVWIVSAGVLLLRAAIARLEADG
jgi:protein-S-isoprenylcysteine O-methyltransferase Ste14